MPVNESQVRGASRFNRGSFVACHSQQRKGAGQSSATSVEREGRGHPRQMGAGLILLLMMISDATSLTPLATLDSCQSWVGGGPAPAVYNV